MLRQGLNPVSLGIAAVRARLEARTLRVVAGCCPKLLREAGLYRSNDEGRDRRSEEPLDGNDHTRDALRYLRAAPRGRAGAGGPRFSGEGA